MKQFFFFLLFCSGTLTASAQASATADTNTPKGFPVLRSYVAPDVVERARKKFGRSLYCIEKTTAADCQNSYLVGLIRNGRLTREWMCDDPKMVRHTNRYASLSADKVG